MYSASTAPRRPRKMPVTTGTLYWALLFSAHPAIQKIDFQAVMLSPALRLHPVALPRILPHLTARNAGCVGVRPRFFH